MKPTLETYGQTGKSAAATLTGLEAFNTVTGKSIAATDIKYVGRAGTTYTESTTAPTDAGKYAAKITLTGVKTSAGDNKSVTASVDYEIAGTATEERKIEEEPLKKVPDELKSLYSTVQQIEKKLLANLMINGQAPAPGQTVFKNVELMISHDGGKTWVKATKDTFPKGGIIVELDYPEGTNGREYRFAVAHMLTVAMNGMKAGYIEKPEVVTTDKKLRVTLNGLSPVAISWTKIDNQAIDSLPQTGDTERPLVYGLAVLFACIGLGVLLKRNNKK